VLVLFQCLFTLSSFTPGLILIGSWSLASMRERYFTA